MRMRGGRLRHAVAATRAGHGPGSGSHGASSRGGACGGAGIGTDPGRSTEGLSCADPATYHAAAIPTGHDPHAMNEDFGPESTGADALAVDAIRQRIAELQLEHRGLDAMISAIGEQPRFDELQLRRLKKRKLRIKDAITLLQMQLVPDEPA